MKDSIIEIKKGIKLHTIQTNKFKTNLFSIFLTTPLKRENVTKNAIIPAILRRGTKNMPTTKKINQKLEEMYGAEFDCGIEKTGDNQIIKFYLEALNDNFIPEKENLMKKSLELLLEIAFNPLVENDEFNEEYFKSEKDNLAQLIESKIDNKDLYAYEKCTEKMYEGKPYSLYKYGYKEDLENLTSKEIYNYYIELLKSAKIDIFVSGEFNEKDIENILNQNENIEKLNEREPEYIVNTEETEKKQNIENAKTIEEKMNVTQGKLVIGMEIKDMKKDERYVATVYNTILGDSANSKMFQNVREKAHLAYSARSMYVRQKNDIVIRCGIEISNYEKALKIIKEQLEDMKNGKFTDEDIDNAKKYIISAIKGVPEEQDTEITYYLGQEIAGTNCSLEEYKENIERVSKEQIQEIAKRLQINTIYFLRN